MPFTASTFARDRGNRPEAQRSAPRRRDLATYVLEAVAQIDPASLQPVAAAEAGVAFQPRNLLALLTYCYASEIYASEDIETAMREEPLFRLLSGNEFPDPTALRRFRRRNREALQACLQNTLARLLETEPDGQTSVGNPDPRAGQSVPGDRARVLDRAQPAAAAEQRIEQAILMDFTDS